MILIQLLTHISKGSLEVRKYTIDYWNGKDYLKWLDLIYMKNFLLNVFNGKQFRRGHNPTHKVLDLMREKWSKKHGSNIGINIKMHTQLLLL